MPTLKKPSRTKRCDPPPGETQMMGPSDYSEMFHMKKVGNNVDLRASTKKSIRSVCNAKTIANRDAPVKKPVPQKSTSKGFKRSSIKASKHSHSTRRKSKSRRKRASSVGKAVPPNDTPISTGAGVASKRGTTPPLKVDELQMEPEVVAMPPKPKLESGLDIQGFIRWIFSCCTLSDNDDDRSLEPDSDTYYAALPVKTQKMQGSPVASSQGKSKNVSSSKQQ